MESSSRLFSQQKILRTAGRLALLLIMSVLKGACGLIWHCRDAMSSPMLWLHWLLPAFGELVSRKRGLFCRDCGHRRCVENFCVFRMEQRSSTTATTQVLLHCRQ